MKKKSTSLNASELEKLEKLTLSFGKKFNIIDIVGEFVYGYSDNKKEYLGTRKDYEDYRKLKSKNHVKDNKSEKYKARKSYIKDLSKD